MPEFFSLLEFSALAKGVAVGGTLILLYCGYQSIHVVSEGYRCVFFYLGKARAEVGAGWYVRPFPFWRVRIGFCGEQNELLPEKQEVTTKDGITCSFKGSISFLVENLLLSETVVDDQDQQIGREAMAEIHRWVRVHTYDECREKNWDLALIPETVELARAWGLRILRLNITHFGAANAEARSVVFIGEIAKRRVAALKEFQDATNDPLLIAAMMGMQISAVTSADQLAALKDQIQEECGALREALARKEPTESVLGRVGEEVAAAVPGGSPVLSLVHSLKGERNGS